MQMHLEVTTKNGKILRSNSNEWDEETRVKFEEHIEDIFEEGADGCFTIEDELGKHLIPVSSVDFVSFIKDF